MEETINKTYRFLFGPVPSRRLGRSLGVDLLPKKVCTYNCVYCQVGKTTFHSVDRRDWVPADLVKEELLRKFSEDVHIDYVTFAGSGEPTLHSQLGNLIDWVKATDKHKVAVLTNGSLLWKEDVRRDLMNADLVVPSFDAANEKIWRKVNHAPASLDFQIHKSGIQKFCSEFKGNKWLEILLVKDINDSLEHLDQLAEAALSFDVEKVQIHTVTRPPAFITAKPASKQAMQYLAEKIGKRSELVLPAVKMDCSSEGISEEIVLAMLSRRPCTMDDIANGLSANINEVSKIVGILFEQGKLASENVNGLAYFKVTKR